MRKNKKLIYKIMPAVLTAGIITGSFNYAANINISYAKESVSSTATKATITTTTFPNYYPDSALKKLSDKEIARRVEALVNTMTNEEKFTFLGGNGTGLQGNAGYLPGVPRLGVPESRMYDGPAGVLSLYDTTNPPQEQMLAATWDPSLAYDYGVIHGSENAAIGGNMQLGDQVDITRSAYFGRSKDQMGEDPYLLSSLASELTKGIQSENVMAVLKHYTAYAQNGKIGQQNIVVSPQALHEIYQAGFEGAIVNGGATGVMSTYYLVNGEGTSDSDYLLKDVLRDMYDFKGFTITDWGSNPSTSIDNGTDIEMPTLSLNSEEALATEIKDAAERQKVIDTAVTHVLTAYGSTGYLGLVEVYEGSDGQLYCKEQAGRKQSNPIQLKQDEEELISLQDKNNESALKIAEEGGVLLKNEDNVLPLKKDNTTAVIGINGMNLLSGEGGERSYGTISEMTSPYEALTDILGTDKVEGQVANDIIGVAIPAESLYVDDSSDKNGVVRSYGTGSDDGSGAVYQGQFRSSGTVAKTKMMNDKTGKFEEIGTYCTTDSIVDFNTGTVDGKPNKTYKVDSADPGTANAFKKTDGKVLAVDSKVESDGVAYTWTTYVEAPESGTFSIILEGIGGSVAASVVTGVDENGKDQSTSFGIASINQGTQWPSDSIIPTETGMSIKATSVEMKKGERYKVTVSGIASLTEKDLQVRLAWITPSQKEGNYNNAIQAAKNNDVSVVFAYRGSASLGSTREDSTLALDSSQQKLILDVASAAHKAGNKVVVVLNADSAVTMEKWIDKVDGLLYMYYPGQKGGVATAELLTGVVNPSGKLAYTIPANDQQDVMTYSDEAFANTDVQTDTVLEKSDIYWVAKGKMFGITTDQYGGDTAKTAEAVKEYAKNNLGEDGKLRNSYYTEGIMTGYRWYDSMIEQFGKEYEPLFDFGYGLSYTSYKYSDMTVTEKPMDGEEVGYNVTFTITNTGSVDGDEIAQVYLGSAQVPDGIQSAKYQLAGYQRVSLKAGESKEITIHVNERSLSYWNQTEDESYSNTEKWEIASGDRDIYVGASSDNLLFSKTINVTKTVNDNLASAADSTDIPKTGENGSFVIILLGLVAFAGMLTGFKLRKTTK